MDLGNLLKSILPGGGGEIPDREEPMETAENHHVTGRRLSGPYPNGFERILFGMGCFWGVERLFWTTPGVWVTAAGYAAGTTANPTYSDVCTGRTSHNEVVLVVFDPDRISTSKLLHMFWENHDPTQGMRQGNDVGTQYRSGIYFTTPEQQRLASASRDLYQMELVAAGLGSITTEIKPAPEFYFAEEEHQQYLAKNPNGYCNMSGTGILCPVPLDR